MGIAEKNNAQLYQHNGLTPSPCGVDKKSKMAGKSASCAL